MDVVRRIQRTFSILLFLLLVPQRPARGGFLFLASPGYDGIHPAGLWGGLLNHSSHGRAQDLFSQGYQDISLPTAYVYDGIRVDTLSYDPRTRTALVQVEDTKRGLSVVGRGAVCQGYGPYAYITSPDSSPNIPLITLLPDVRLVDRDNPYFLDAACGWRCGWGGFALFDDKIYFVLTAVFGLRRSELRRQVQIRVMTSACDDLIQKAIKYEQVDIELPILSCSDHVVTVLDHLYDSSHPVDTWVASPLKVVQEKPGGPMYFLLQVDVELPILSCSDHVVTVLDHPYDSSHPVDTWVASPLKVVQEKSGGPMYFLLQLIQKADCDVTMSLVQTSRQSGLSTWVHNVSLPSIYGGNPQIRGFGSIDYRDGMLCWTAAEVLLCGPIAGDQVSLVSMLLPPGAAHTAGICSGDLPLAKVLTGVAVASSAPLRVYFGCYSELTGHGGAGLVEVNLSSASEIVKHVYPVTSAGRKVYASGLFFVDTLCGPCTENCGTGEQTTSFQKSTASGVSSLTSRPWMDDGSAENMALTGCARTLVATLRTVVSLLIHIMIVLSLIL